jgi:hypothetical protein
MSTHATHAKDDRPHAKPQPKTGGTVAFDSSQIGRVLVGASGVITALACITQGRLSEQLVLTDGFGVPVVAFGSDMAGGRAIAGPMAAPFDGSLTLSACPDGSSWSLEMVYA